MPKIFWTISTLIPHCLNKSFWAKRAGCSNTTHPQNDKWCSGKGLTNWGMKSTHISVAAKVVADSFFTRLLLGRYRSSSPFWNVFLISVALSLSVILRLSNITPAGSETRMVGRNIRWKRDNKKKTLKTILLAVLSYLRIFYQ